MEFSQALLAADILSRRRQTNLGRSDSSIEVQSGVERLVEWIDGQRLGVEVVGFLPVARFECLVTLFFFRLQELGFLVESLGLAVIGRVL